VISQLTRSGRLPYAQANIKPYSLHWGLPRGDKHRETVVRVVNRRAIKNVVAYYKKGLTFLKPFIPYLNHISIKNKKNKEKTKNLILNPKKN